MYVYKLYVFVGFLSIRLYSEIGTVKSMYMYLFNMRNVNGCNNRNCATSKGVNPGSNMGG